MKTAIVLGATGLIGRSLVEQLSADDHIGKVIVITRRPVDYPFTKVVNEVVDFENLDAFSALFCGDLLFSCLGTTAKQAGSITAQRRVDLDYQYKAAKISADNGVHHYLLVSSSGANHQSKNQYFKMKGELELKIKALAFARITVFKPSLLVGARDVVRVGEMLASWLLRPLCLLPGLKRFRPISGAEVATKMVEVSQLPGMSFEEYQLDEVFPSTR